jgi:NADPH:quinone reductase-like Zn-dependent oxidoreductase
MQAVVYHKYGTPEELKLAEVEKPSPQDNEVLIKIKAASINSWDWDLLTGTFQGRIGAFRKPRTEILGCDIAGTVEAVGNKVTQFKEGDNVFGDMSGFGARDWGGFAEYACAREEVLALKSDKMTFEQAAATPQAGVLALQGLYDIGHIKSWHDVGTGRQKILINGAGGGGGTFAIQIAKTEGAEITGVDSTEKLEAVRALGCDHVIDYRKEDFTQKGKEYDLILDVRTTRSVFDIKRALSRKGIYVTVGGTTGRLFQLALLGSIVSGDKKIKLLGHKPTRKDLDTLTSLFEEGKVVPVIDRFFKLSELAQAFSYFGEGKFVGKVVITI